MTECNSVYKDRLNLKPILQILCLGLSVSMILLGEKIRKYVYDGLVFSFSTIIPTLFPFFILSDLWSSVCDFTEDGRISKLFNRLFGISGQGIVAFFLGCICGFPIGVKLASELYEDQIITEDEAERLYGFANNPSVAFVISGIGVGIYGSLKIGLLLYLSIITSAFLVGILFKRNLPINTNSKHKGRQKFNLVNSISHAGITSINVASCIVFFSGLLGLIDGFLRNQAAVSTISLFTEIATAIKLISSASLSTPLKLILSGFALGFSGFSVHFQAFSFFPPEIRKSRYLLMKITQGLICAILISLFIFLVQMKGAAL